MKQPVNAFEILNEIGIINQLSTSRFERSLGDGLTRSQFSVLNNFVRLGGTRTPAELADAFQVTRGAMTNTLKRLADRGCIKIDVSDEDRRSKIVTITAQGRRLRNSSIAATQSDLAELVEAVGEQTLRNLQPLLTKLRVYLDDHRSAD
ncbi:MAG: DNA-binding MarR family transcriptional regulator [Candidatus Azotimanducaceae bacterium]|jgi:DNA-binding MarR family transcriptional regulator